MPESRNSRQIIRLCSESNRKKNLHRTGTFRIMEEAASGHLNVEYAFSRLKCNEYRAVGKDHAALISRHA